MSSLFVIIPGFGCPNLDVKTQILTHNISKLRSYNWSKLTIRVCVYDDSPIPQKLSEVVEVVRTPGLPGDFIHNFAKPDDLIEYDYILVLFDDILLLPNVDIASMIKLKEFFKLDIVSPTLTLDSKYVYEYMLTQPDKSFATYYQHVDPTNNPWLWGVDLVLYLKINLRVGLMNNMNMKHFFAQTCYNNHKTRNPQDGFAYTMKKYDVTAEELSKQPAAMFYIMQSSHI